MSKSIVNLQLLEEPSIIAGHFNENDQYYTKREVGLRDWLITYTLDGAGYFHTLDQQIISKKHDLTLLKSTVHQHYGTVKGQHWNFLWAHFDATLLTNHLLPDTPLLHLSIDNESIQQRIEQALHKVVLDFRERHAYWNELCTQAIHEVLLLIARKRKQKFDTRVEYVLYMLGQHFRRHLTIDQLAHEVNLSASRLSHLFKDSTGTSIIDTVNQMRIREAALLLEHTDRSATEVAYEVGFHNYNHFINQFHKWYGTSPSQFRKTKRPNN